MQSYQQDAANGYDSADGHQLSSPVDAQGDESL